MAITFTLTKPPINPLSISDMHLWFDFSDTSTLYQDTGGTTPITADGQSLSRANDKSGNGYHAVADAGFTPTYEESEQNGRSVMQGPSLHADGWTELPQPYTILLASQSPNTGGGSIKPTVFGNVGSGNPRVQFQQRFNIGVQFRSNNALNMSIGNNIWNAYTFVVNSPNTEVYIGQTLDVSGDSGSGNLHNILLNDSFDANDSNNGQIGEVLVYNRALTTKERKDLINYLKNKWGV